MNETICEVCGKSAYDHEIVTYNSYDSKYDMFHANSYYVLCDGRHIDWHHTHE